MWIFSKELIQNEYPGSDGKQSKDPTGRTILRLSSLGHSNNLVLAIVHLLVGKDWLLGQLLLTLVFLRGQYL